MRRRRGYAPASVAPPVYDFSDEFPVGSLDLSKWTRENLGYGYGSLETFKADADLCTINANGQLVISAIKDQPGPRTWRAGFLTTRGHFTMKTGTVEIRAKLPTEQGAWTAIWMHDHIGASGEAGTPHAEIDIMEQFPGGGSKGPGAYFTIHDWSAGTDKGDNLTPSVGAQDGNWHVWRTVWSAAKMELFIDDVSQGSWTPTSFAAIGDFTQFTSSNFYLIFDFAVGTSWGGPEPIPATTRMDMLIDYVRITKTS